VRGRHHVFFSPRVEPAASHSSPLDQPAVSWLSPSPPAELDVVAVAVAETEIVFVAVASVADVAKPQASFDIAPAFDVLVPLFVVADEVDSPGRPTLLAFPSVDYYAKCASSVEVVG
jgi:hypothetical protein